MFENILATSIFVSVLIFAFVSVLAINVVVAFVNLGINMYMKAKKIKWARVFPNFYLSLFRLA